MNVNTYYFDGSVSAVSDPNSVFTNDSNLTDGTTTTYATTTSNGSSASNYLTAQGTTAPSSGSDTIVAVRMRAYRYVGVTAGPPRLGLKVVSGSDTISDTVQAVQVTSGAYGVYIDLAVPTGGWTWSALANLTLTTWFENHITTCNLGQVEIEVHSSASNLYYFPDMNGKAVNLTGVSGARYLPTQDVNDQAVVSAQETIDMHTTRAAQLSNWKMNIATAPGTGITRTQTLMRYTSASIVTFDIVDPATSGSDTTHTISVAPDANPNFSGRVAFRFTASGTPAATLSNSRITWMTERQQLRFNTVSNLSASANRWVGIQDIGINTTSETSARQYMPEAGGVKDFNISVVSGTIITTGSYAIDLMVNGVSAVTLTLDASNQYAVDSGNTRSWSQGDTVSVQSTPTSTPTAVAIRGGGEYISGSSAANFILLSSPNGNIGTAAATHNTWGGAGAFNATESNVQALAYSSTLIGGYFVLSADTGAAKTRTITFRQNGADTATLATFNNSGTTKTYSGSVSISTDDLICTKQTPSGTPTNSSLKYGLVFQANAVPSATAVKDMIGSGLGIPFAR